eukprot:8788579-Pyramimonas_sp.AAC.1
MALVEGAIPPLVGAVDHELLVLRGEVASGRRRLKLQAPVFGPDFGEALLAEAHPPGLLVADLLLLTK